MFEDIANAPPDPIFALMHRFNGDQRPSKINLTVGVYQDEFGKTPILDCVKSAEQKLVGNEKTKSYLGIAGSESFNSATRGLVLGSDHPAIESGCAKTIQTPGGTGALRLAADFVADLKPEKSIFCTTPTWPNHLAIFEAAGASVKKLRYLSDDNTYLDFAGYLEEVQQIPAGNAVLLHTCCHNPSGFDPSKAEWAKLLEVVKQQGLFPIFDFAYQGFDISTKEDAWPIHHAIELGCTVLVCNSFSKNMGLYAERVGGLTVVGSSAGICQAIISQLKSYARAIYSNPPKHGAQVAATILNDSGLREQWQAELKTMRERLSKMRELFVSTLKTTMPDQDFTHIGKQHGMFSYTGLTAEQADVLLDEHAIYLLRSGRVNIAGINHKNVQTLCDAIASVTSQSVSS